MQRIGVLNGNNITYDHDLAGLVRGLTDSGVIQGGEITGNKVQPVQAVIACKRSNGQKLMLYFESDEQVAIPSSGTFKVYIEVEQSKIDDGTGNAENGTGIASIKTWPTLPSQNSLLLASVADWSITDERNLIPKVQELSTRTSLLEQQGAQSAALLDQIEEGISSDHIGFSLRAGENIQVNDVVFAQKLSNKSEYTIDVKIGYSSDESAPQIQLISNGKPITHIDLKLSKVGDPTYGLTCTLYEAEEISGTIPRWKQKGAVLAIGQVGAIISTADVVRITFADPIQRPKGTKLVAVIDTVGSARSTVNYYQLWCHTQQFSEIIRFGYQTSTSFVSKNLMPYLDGEGFYTEFLVKSEEEKKIEIDVNKEVKKISENPWGSISDWERIFTIYEFKEDGKYTLTMDYQNSFSYERYYLNIVNNVINNTGWGSYIVRNSLSSYHFYAKKWDILKIKIEEWNSSRNIEFKSITITQTKKTLSKTYHISALSRWNYQFGKVAEATLLGMHNGEFVVKKSNKIILSKILDWSSATRESPSDWFLEVSWNCYFHQWSRNVWECAINWTKLSHATWWADISLNWYGWFFIPKWTVSLSATRRWDGRASMTVHSFIPL